jgi:gas vesicle protein
MKTKAFLGVLLIVVSAIAVAVEPQEEKREVVGVGKAAGIGALLGLALGRDPIVGTIQGAALGAAGGLIANTVVQEQDRKERKKEQQKQAEEARRQQQQQQQQAQAAQQAGQDLERQVEEAIGKDNYEGYKALRACQHKRAAALAKVGATSENEDYRITSIWLDAMIAVDQRDSEKTDEYLAEIVEKDPDIDTVQQASIESDKVVLEMRNERRELGISCR